MCSGMWMRTFLGRGADARTRLRRALVVPSGQSSQSPAAEIPFCRPSRSPAWRPSTWGELKGTFGEYWQARTQDFAQEGATCSRRGPPGYPGAPWRLGALETRGPRMTAGAHWVIRGPSGNQRYINETLIYIFLPSKRFIHCLEKYSGA